MPDPYINELLKRFFQGTISMQEKESLARWIQESGEEDHLKELMQQSWQQFEPKETLPAARADELLQSILTEARSMEMKPARQIPARTRVLPFAGKIAIAASILIALGISSYFLFFKQGSHTEIVNTTDPIPKDVIAPTGTKAMITLANGRRVAWDSIPSGTLAIQGKVNVVKMDDGQIVYTGSNDKVEYNTLVNPRGSNVVSLTLSDGTRVWLNAGSSLTYFTSVGAGDRQVQITGEAYFEVAKNTAQPFIVKKEDAEITVLGTHFNVNAYQDEPDMKVTLFEGSVKVTKNNAAGVLRPGQQARVDNDIKVINDADEDVVMAWKNGLFNFDDNDLRDIMRQLSRWYDADIIYEGMVPEKKITGQISRKVNVSNVLKMIELTGKVEFRIEGRKIFVKAK